MDQVRQTARLKHFSPKTIKSYLYYIHDFILFHNNQRPNKLGTAEIRANLSQLTIRQIPGILEGNRHLGSEGRAGPVLTYLSVTASRYD